MSLSCRQAVTLLVAASIGLPAFAAEPVKVMTFNIRYGTAPDGENAWPHRQDLVVQVIRDFDPDLLGLQEALRGQLDELDEALDGYTRIGVGRDADGGGEYSAVYLRRTRFDVHDAGTLWLSATPETPGSTTWGNTLPRICTWVRLLDRVSGRRLLLANTHWDHQSQPAREESGRLMADRIGPLVGGGLPVIVTGDFNAAPDNTATKTLLAEAELRDSFAVAHPDEANVGTFNGFGQSPQSGRIDYVLASGHWQVRDAAIVRDKPGGRYPSDHFPVTATLVLDASEAPAAQ